MVVSVTDIIGSAHIFFKQLDIMVNKPLFCFLSEVVVVNLSSTTNYFPWRMVNPAFHNT